MPIDDTMVMSFDLDAGQSLAGHGMDEIARQVLDYTCIAYKEVTGTGKSAVTFAQVPLPQATRYAAEDADVTWACGRASSRASPARARRASTSWSTGR